MPTVGNNIYLQRVVFSFEIPGFSPEDRHGLLANNYFYLKYEDLLGELWQAGTRIRITKNTFVCDSSR